MAMHKVLVILNGLRVVYLLLWFFGLFWLFVYWVFGSSGCVWVVGLWFHLVELFWMLLLEVFSFGLSVVLVDLSQLIFFSFQKNFWC